MPPSNTAAFLTAKSTPLKVQKSIYTPPGDNEMVVKNAALAINPYDWIIQSAPNLVVSWVKLPFVLGTDIAGSIVEVGENITRFHVGDRVVAHAAALIKTANRSWEGAFQEYTVVREDLTSSIPDFMAFEAACVLPLALSTAACALFQKDFLALPFPTMAPTPSGKTLLVWGGSTSVGCNAIQLAVACGYEVITTASPKNHALVKKLGAVQAFDYRSETAIADIIAAFKSRTCAGAVSIGAGSFRKCIQVLGSCTGNRFVAQVSMDLPPFPDSAFGFPPFLISMLGTVASAAVSARMNGVSSKMVNGGDLMGNEVGRAIYRDFLPEALGMGRFVPAPETRVVGKGLEYVQEAMDLNKKGVSAKKLVVTL